MFFHLPGGDPRLVVWYQLGDQFLCGFPSVGDHVHWSKMIPKYLFKQILALIPVFDFLWGSDGGCSRRLFTQDPDFSKQKRERGWLILDRLQGCKC